MNAQRCRLAANDMQAKSGGSAPAANGGSSVASRGGAFSGLAIEDTKDRARRLQQVGLAVGNLPACVLRHLGRFGASTRLPASLCHYRKAAALVHLKLLDEDSDSRKHVYVTMQTQ